MSLTQNGRRPNSDSAISNHSAPPLGGQLTNVEEMKKGESNILVAIRLRPMLEKEITEGRFNLVKILDEKVVVL